jgi:cytochrome P450
MHRFADMQIEKLRRKGRADLSDLSFDLAVKVAAEVIGITPAKAGMSRRLERFFKEYKTQPGLRSPAQIYRLIYQNFSLGTFYLFDVRPATKLRRKERRDDLISHLLDEGCNDGEVLGECVTFAAAGMITTREFITVAAWHLFTDETLRTAYLNGEEADRLAILHEILRLEPVIANLTRRTTAEVEVPDGSGPARIPAGTRVDVAIGQANLDPATVGPQPGQLCPARPLPDGVPAAGLSFGDGPHRCPGAHIAIQETEIFLTKLFALPNVRMEREPKTRIRREIASYELAGMILTVE